MALLAGSITRSTPAIGMILVAIVLVGALASAGYFIGRRYVNTRISRRH